MADCPRRLHCIQSMEKLQTTYGIIQFDLNNLLVKFVSLGLHNLYIKQKIFSEVATSSKYLWKINTIISGPDIYVSGIKTQLVYHVKYFY
jgi:hypothetical protein